MYLKWIGTKLQYILLTITTYYSWPLKHSLQCYPNASSSKPKFEFWDFLFEKTHMSFYGNSTGLMLHISLAYSWMVLSLLNLYDPAVFSIDILVHLWTKQTSFANHKLSTPFISITFCLNKLVSNTRFNFNFSNLTELIRQDSQSSNQTCNLTCYFYFSSDSKKL